MEAPPDTTSKIAQTVTVNVNANGTKKRPIAKTARNGTRTPRRRKERPVTPLVDANGHHALLAKT